MRQPTAMTAILCLALAGALQGQDGPYHAGKEIPVGGELVQFIFESQRIVGLGRPLNVKWTKVAGTKLLVVQKAIVVPCGLAA